MTKQLSSTSSLSSVTKYVPNVSSLFQIHLPCSKRSIFPVPNQFFLFQINLPCSKAIFPIPNPLSLALFQIHCHCSESTFPLPNLLFTCSKPTFPVLVPNPPFLFQINSKSTFLVSNLPPLSKSAYPLPNPPSLFLFQIHLPWPCSKSTFPVPNLPSLLQIHLATLQTITHFFVLRQGVVDHYTHRIHSPPGVGDQLKDTSTGRWRGLAKELGILSYDS